MSRLRAAFSARAAVRNSSAQDQSPVPIDVELIPHRVASVEAFRPIWHSLRTVHDWLTNPPAVWA